MQHLIQNTKNNSVFTRGILLMNWFKALFLQIPLIALYCILFISLLIIEYFNFHLSPDISNQLHSLKNFADGNGITIASINENGKIIYQPLSLWPAGMVIFLMPFYFITKSTIASALLLKITANFFFILFLSNYFRYLQLEDYKKKFIVFFFMIAVAPFIHFYPSDTLATVLCLWGFYFNLKYQDTGKYFNLFKAVLLLALSYFVKYSFLPFLLYPVTSFFFNEGLAVIKKWKQLFIIAFISIFTVVIFYTLNDSLVGKSSLVSAWDALNGKPHWNQLSRFDGFLFTFGNYEWAFENLLKNYLGISFQFNWISILVTVYFYILFLSTFFSRKQTVGGIKFLRSINISLSGGGLIIFFLALLTVNNPGQTWATPYWTFVEESRYFAPIIFIGLINILVIFLTRRPVSFLHIIIPIMMLLNLFAYKFVIQNGSRGKNYKTYTKTQKNISISLSDVEDNETTVVFFEKETNKTLAYYYLLSQGAILADKKRYSDIKGKLYSFSIYFLKTGSNDAVIIPLN